MKSLIKILVLAVVFVATSCNKSTAPNYQFMPNMYESAGYETYGEAAFPNGIEAQLPAQGSIPRGYVPFDIENSTEGYNLAKEIQRADSDERASAIMLIVNSGGGSPVQGETAYSFIRSYTDKPLTERKPLYVSIQAICASACYQAISPADKIYAHKSSMVGSIGVRMDSWDLTGLAEKLGVKKQILTSVDKKVIIDPFKKLKVEDEQLLRDSLMMPMHTNFVSSVLEARKDKLENDVELFNGMVWLGEDAKSKGFIDGISSTIEVENELMEITGTKDAKSVSAQGFSISRLIGGIL